MFKKGRAAREAVEKHREKQEQEAASRDSKGKYSIHWASFFRLPKNSESEIVILDKSFDDAPALYLTQLTPPGETMGGDWYVSSQSINPEAPDLLVELATKNGYKVKTVIAYVMSCLELKPAKSKKFTSYNDLGFQRKLFVLKSKADTEKWQDIIVNAEEEFGTIRGLNFKIKRGDDNKSSTLGDFKLGKGGRVYSLLSGEEIDERFSHGPIGTGDTPWLKANELKEAYDYNDYLKIMPEEDIYKMFDEEPPQGAELIESKGVPEEDDSSDEDDMEALYGSDD